MPIYWHAAWDSPPPKYWLPAWEETLHVHLKRLLDVYLKTWVGQQGMLLHGEASQS